MNILAALDRIVAVQESLEITEPLHTTIKRAYTLPPSGKMLNDIPCFVNSVELQPTIFSASVMRRNYTVNMQGFFNESRVALAFEEELLRAFAQDVMLDGAITNIVSIRGLLTGLEWGGKFYPGLDYFMDISMSEGQVFTPGRTL